MRALAEEVNKETHTHTHRHAKLKKMTSKKGEKKRRNTNKTPFVIVRGPLYPYDPSMQFLPFLADRQSCTASRWREKREAKTQERRNNASTDLLTFVSVSPLSFQRRERKGIDIVVPCPVPAPKHNSYGV